MYFDNRQKVLEILAKCVREAGIEFAMPARISLKDLEGEGTENAEIVK